MTTLRLAEIDHARSISITSPAPRPVWKSILSKDPNALVTQSPEWLDCICATGNYEDASRLYEIPNRGMFVIPMVRSRFVPLRLATLSSPPSSWGMGGLIGDVPIESEDVKAICDDLARSPGLRKLIRPNPLLDDSWRVISGAGISVVPRQAHIIDLRKGFDHIWNKGFDANTRRNLRKAESSGLKIECDQTGRLIPVFYQLFLQSVERWADNQHEPHWLALYRARRRDPNKKFQLMAKHLGSAFRLWVAWHQGEPAAAILVLQGTNAHYTRGAMNIDLAGPTRANDLLHRSAIEEACKSGCRYYHMGETGKSDSLARFKSRFGAEAVPYAEYRFERLPISRMDAYVRGTVKKMIGFKDV